MCVCVCVCVCELCHRKCPLLCKQVRTEVAQYIADDEPFFFHCLHGFSFLRILCFLMISLTGVFEPQGTNWPLKILVTVGYRNQSEV